jgi:hypothetical protein
VARSPRIGHRDGGIADNQAIIIDGVTLTFDHALPAARGAPVEIGIVDRLAVIGFDILLGRDRHLVDRSVEEVDDRRRIGHPGCEKDQVGYGVWSNPSNIRH